MQVWSALSFSSGATECGAALLPGDIKDSSSSEAVALQDGCVTANSWRLSRARQLLYICNFVDKDLVIIAYALTFSTVYFNPCINYWL